MNGDVIGHREETDGSVHWMKTVGAEKADRKDITLRLRGSVGV